MRRDPAFVVLGPITMDYRRVNKALPSLIIFGGILLLVSTGALQISTAAVFVAPIAISSAVTLGVAPQAFAMGVAIAASNSFLFPIGHQASVVVYSPGGYRFFDYTKVGLPLTLPIWLLMIIFLPILWPLQGA